MNVKEMIKELEKLVEKGFEEYECYEFHHFEYFRKIRTIRPYTNIVENERHIYFES